MVVDLEAFADRVTEDLWGAIDAEFPAKDALDSWLGGGGYRQYSL